MPPRSQPTYSMANLLTMAGSIVGLDTLKSDAATVSHVSAPMPVPGAPPDDGKRLLGPALRSSESSSANGSAGVHRASLDDGDAATDGDADDDDDAEENDEDTTDNEGDRSNHAAEIVRVRGGNGDHSVDVRH